MYEEDATAGEETKKLPHWSRISTVEHLTVFEQGGPTLSQREFARSSGVPRTTLQHWLARKASLDTDPVVTAFFESPSGLAWIHRIVAAVHVACGQVGPCGVRQVSLFLRLSELDRFVASSVGSQQKVCAAMEELVVQFGQEERVRLAAEMPHRRISVCQDETFHPETCLVGIEPVSNFILMELYSPKRDAPTWTEAMKQHMLGLDVEIVQAVSDEAKGLLRHAREGLGAHHSTDLFHVQHEVSKGTSLALSSRVHKAAEELQDSRDAVRKHLEQQEAYNSVSHGPGHPPAFDKRIASARQVEEQAEQELREAQERQAQAQEAIRAIGQSYHPFRLDDGQSRTPEQLETQLLGHFTSLESIAAAAGLSQRSQEHIAKAKRQVGSMVATLAFFFLQLRLALAELAMDPALESHVRQSLLPGLYLEQAAAKAPDAKQRAELRAKAQELLSIARAEDGPLGTLPEERRQCIEAVARQCIELFQRSSSCVEGRNGQLALRHHSFHRLSERKLAALTTLHNYFLRRPDGTTAAERFFGAKPRDLFRWILDRLEIPARPAQSRSREKLKAS